MPEVLSIDFHDTIAYPEYITILDKDIIVSGGTGYNAFTRAHSKEDPSIFRDYYLSVYNLKELKTVDNKLLLFPLDSYFFLGDEKIDLECNVRCVYTIPDGFVIVALSPVECEYEHVPGMLLFYEKNKYTHMTLTPHVWSSITWVGDNGIAFAATRLLKGKAEVSWNGY